ncbi:MAG: M15 family metallopeptidase [Longibaculum muris]|uniref:D-alanyl-D-alanine carboxypeptidase-like protein n=1 Tax=Longibaculum muris TaxID=1796628 RepID=A0A4R3Z6H7_9FIRM|nr:M15 family metallopeptidase [Longibaculum muris]MBS5368863.1 M15 family metallopeptidase [Coprobacillus cateniformis]MCR1887893.1 M15 family metallopeptidase [Longibaculum muris]MED9812160.1 M15 family metallopeptidase [Longibaculum muris]TCW01202.1 D-alanyl-D-alanine carboxypeptidase-like protein [Longibaculum muris]
MKLKTWYLFLVIIILFGCSFYIVNLKFDKFYRVNGINNDNRVLIEKYLDEKEQSYLIDNQISIDLFIDYIEYNDFHLENYQYYNALKATNRYRQIENILETGNSLATRLGYLFNNQSFQKAKLLIDRDLELAFLNEENFNFDYIDIYSTLAPLYAQKDYSYIQDGAEYVLRLNQMGIQTIDDLNDTMNMLTTAYNQKSLHQLLTTTLPENVHIVYNPYELSTLVDNMHYIGNYEPKGLLLVQDIPRMRYAMYLQSDAYHALLKMYQDLSQKFNGFLLKEAYVSHQDLSAKKVGYDESQLGLTITVTQSQTTYNSFSQTEMSQWLEEHAYEYGFILRYPQRKASITNHTYDAHIYRYVGKSLAKSLHDSQMTLEEYQSQTS